MSSIKEKISQNEKKIAQLENNIKRDTEKRKKLIDENSRLGFQALCEEYKCSGNELFEIISKEHQQVQMIEKSASNRTFSENNYTQNNFIRSEEKKNY